ncbi:conserved hypothetical protein [Teredinibacter turnerae T7901]|uniref:DUF4194 domain-containing protein n=1 Tax=Teredinibacter turnerae (strain ATCC 39867 / T7901) TaxID=377629 RepID=C5BMN8_TERTT|nr:DUF4194 domain-containing protein [Teredinibacter turnerae]ACR14081.1 conserved hypothetical protein [Teredinibacter turnerae T7901]
MLDTFISEQLQTCGLRKEEFSELLIRLLDYGVICREESQIEATLYDRYLQCTDLVEAYLALVGIRILHDRQFNFVRLFPPGAEIPGMSDDDNSPFNSGFRVRPNQQEIAVILALRAEYEKALREGQVDERGQVLIPLESLAIAMNNLLKRHLPETQVDRKRLFTRLRQLRLIQFNQEDDFESNEIWLSIQPSITSFVTEAVLNTLGEPLPESEEPATSEAEPESTMFNDEAPQ